MRSDQCNKLRSIFAQVLALGAVNTLMNLIAQHIVKEMSGHGGKGYILRWLKPRAGKSYTDFYTSTVAGYLGQWAYLQIPIFTSNAGINST